MILPQSFTSALLLVALALFALSLWPNTLRVAKGWRFELYYFDFVLGFLGLAGLSALTLGSAGEELSFSDNFLVTGKRQMLFAGIGGALFNLGNMLAVASFSISAMSLSFPVSAGIGLVIAILCRHFLGPIGDVTLIYSGVALVVAGVVLTILGHVSFLRTGGAKTTMLFSVKALLLAIGGGLFLGLSYPFLVLARAGELGLGPYPLLMVMAIGAILTTLIANLYFMNLPVQGKPVPVVAYLQGSLKNHLLGMLGGAICAAGLLAALLASTAAGVPLGATAIHAIATAAFILTAVWGILFWKELQPIRSRPLTFVAIGFFLFIVAVGLIVYGSAPQFAAT